MCPASRRSGVTRFQLQPPQQAPATSTNVATPLLLPRLSLAHRVPSSRQIRPRRCPRACAPAITPAQVAPQSGPCTRPRTKPRPSLLPCIGGTLHLALRVHKRPTTGTPDLDQRAGSIVRQAEL